jgi:hypothetical protein
MYWWTKSDPSNEAEVDMWPDTLDNPQAVYSAFLNGVPELEGLRLGRLMIDSAGSVFLGLEAHPLPGGSPSRWAEQGKDGLEYRFAFYDVCDLSIAGTARFLDPSLTFELDKGASRLYSHDRAFSAAFTFRGVRIFLHAFSTMRRTDLQDFWPPFYL